MSITDQSGQKLISKETVDLSISKSVSENDSDSQFQCKFPQYSGKSLESFIDHKKRNSENKQIGLLGKRTHTEQKSSPQKPSMFDNKSALDGLRSQYEGSK